MLKKAAVTNKRKIQDPLCDKVLYAVIHTLLILLLIIIGYPLIFVVSSSFSDPTAVSSGKVVFLPVDFSLKGYEAVFSHKYIMLGYRNTIFYTVTGTLINLAVTLTAAYALYRRECPFRRFFMIMFTLTMFFSGGLIPGYMQIVNLGLIDTIWAILLPGAISVYNMILVRTFLIGGIPNEMLEATQIDGLSDAGFFFQMVLPLAKPVIACVTLFYAVGHWNSYFSAMLYLNDIEKQPLQLFLRNILVENEIMANQIQDPKLVAAKQGMSDLLKYSLIIVSSGPIIALYPFIQKYFIKGVMIGAIKG
ncbi:MAG: carbohydrate ABC transporter permease [Clostridia bacterium]|nr:carbohydrate ABC transporter permease [Clostridia bacterium]